MDGRNNAVHIRECEEGRVPENELTKDFIEARNMENYFCWSWLERNCRKRHTWGWYLRSDPDWDSDVTYCMKRMFKLPDSWVQATLSSAMQNVLVPDATPEVVLQ